MAAGQHVWSIAFTATIFALTGTSFALAYAATRVFNLAHSLVYALAAYSLVTLVAAGVWLPMPMALGLAGVVGAGAGIVSLSVTALPAWRTNDTRLLFTLAIALVGETILSLVFGDSIRTVVIAEGKPLHLFGALLPAGEIHVLAFGWTLLLLIELAFNARFGLAMRAFCDSSAAATASGLDVRRIRRVLSAMAGICAGVAAGAWGWRYNVRPDVGLTILIPGIVVALGATVLHGHAFRPRHIWTSALSVATISILGSLASSWRWREVILYGLLFVLAVVHAYARKSRRFEESM